MLKKGFKFFLVLISVFVIDIIHVDAANSYVYLNKKNITTDLYSSAVQQSKQDIIIENNMSINYKIDTQKEYYYYDTKDSKLYFVIRLTVIDTDDDTRFVIDSKTEIN